MDRRAKKNLAMLAELSPEQKAQLEKVEAEAIARYGGPLPDLESALGMLRLGHHFGWRVLYLMHSKATVRKYERILEIKVVELFKDEGPSSPRSLGFEFSKTVSNFWKLVGGAIKYPRRREIVR